MKRNDEMKPAEATEMLHGALCFESSLSSQELSGFRENFRDVVNALAREWGFSSREELLQKSCCQSMAELRNFLSAIHRDLQARRLALQESVVALLYGSEMVPSLASLRTLLVKIRDEAARAENEILKVVMEILYGCVMLAICARA